VVLVGFFAVYDRYVMQPQIKAREAVAQQQNQAEANTSPNAAPIVSKPTSIEAPKTPAPSDDTLVKVKTAIGELTIDELGRVSQAALTEDVFKGDKDDFTLLFDQQRARALEVRFADRALNAQAFQTAYSASEAFVDASQNAADLKLTQNLSGLTIVKELRFYPDGHYDLKTRLSAETDYFITPGFHPTAASDPMTVQGALVHTQNGTVEAIEDGEAKDGEVFSGAKMVSAFDRYYASLFFNYEAPINVVLSSVDEALPLAFVQARGDLALSGYIGPKYVDRLRAIHPELTAAVEYGFFTFLSKPLFAVLEWIYSLIPSWGWSIVIFTLLVKIVLFPLSHKGMVSMSKLKDLAPKMKELQERYKDDKQKLQLHMMELYKKHGANPLGGCLPLLLQIPIFFAIYRVLLNAIELKGAQWLYIGDLSMKDPFFILPILMGATMWFQQRITPSNFTDPMQAKLFKWLPVIFTVFFLFFPAGLVLYWLMNNIVSIAQQWFVNRQMERAKPPHKEAQHGNN
jgi:YidC/Oxa1 family membrane protein insertase